MPIYFMAAVFLSCQDKDDNIHHRDGNFTWITSTVSPENNITVYQFEKGDNGSLYINGWTEDDKSVFEMLVDNNWEIIAQVNELVIGDFVVFEDTVYFSTSLAVKKSKGTYVGTVLNTTTHCALEVYQNQLFIAGSHLLLDGQEYSILSYDRSGAFNPIFQGISNSKIKKVNDKLYISGPVGFPVLIYQNGTIQESDYKNDFLNINEEGFIYSYERNDPNHIVINRFNQHKTEKVGNSITTNILPTRLEFHDSSVILGGHDSNEDTSNSFILGSENKWYAIETGFTIYDLINHDNKILAATDGSIMELTSP